MLKEIFHKAQIHVRCKREILISLLSWKVCNAVLRWKSPVVANRLMWHHLQWRHKTLPPPPPPPLPSPLFSGCFILDQRQTWSRGSGLHLQIIKNLVSLHLCFIFTSPLEKTFQIQRPRNLSLQKVNRIENVEQPRHNYRVLRKNSSSRRNVCNLIRKYFERDFWNQDSRIFNETFFVRSLHCSFWTNSPYAGYNC